MSIKEKLNFDQIFEEYFEKVYHKILSMVNNKQDAEDISQEVFITVYKNLKKFNNKSSLYTWVYRIAINKTYDFFRKHKKSFDLKEEVLYEEESKTNPDNKLLLEEKLKTLNEKDRKIVLLHNIYGYKFNEISKLVNINISTIKTSYYKSVKEMGEI